MFKLESYITPIILSYVDKYVKNVKAERSQVSLWGGDAMFSNLDLRLDVLERELGLPFSFVSGHIHELHIHVPWTRLHAEPIVITINTIECVLRLPGEEVTESDATSSVHSTGSARSVERRKVRTNKQEGEAPPGYVQSLINKIISNVKIVCNNLILKYVEEDIVLSLNTRWLCLSSASAIWEPAFTELSLPDLILRKLLQVKDMTVCLDKRDASGKIETYQEPLLYRCSLSVHAAWCYDSLHAKVPRTARYDVRSQRLDFSLTDTQLPMFLRIVSLVLALYNGDLDHQNGSHAGGAGGNEQKGDGDPENNQRHDHPSAGGDGEGGSWTGWAWNVGSSVGSFLLPVYWEDEETDTDLTPLDVRREKIFHVGFYVDSASLAIKLTERQKEKSLFGSTKLRFSPFLRLDLSGLVHEAVVKGIHTVNVTGGISEVCLVPVGDCLCGARDTSLVTSSGNSESNNETRYIYAGCPIVEGKKRSFLRGSLFEKDFGDESGDAVPSERRRSYDINYDRHTEDVTEESLLEKTPALALDFLYHLELPDDLCSERISELESDLENSNLNERALCRLVFGPTQVKVCSGSLHRMTALFHLASLYDYPPYSVSNEVDQLLVEPGAQASLADEASSLLQQGSPIRIYQVTAINPSVIVYAGDHDKFTPSSLSTMPRSSSTSSKVVLNSVDGGRLPSLVLKMEYLDSQAVIPMYPRRLVKVVSNLQSPSHALMQLCQSSFTLKLLHASGHLVSGEHSASVLQPSNVLIGLRKLVLGEFWKKGIDQLVLGEYSFDIQTLRVRLTRPQLALVNHIVDALLWQDFPKPAKLLETSLLEDALGRRLPILVLSLTAARLQYAHTRDIITVQIGLRDFSINLSTQLNATQTSSIPILTKATADYQSGNIAARHLTATLGSDKSPTKMSPGRARARPTFAKLSGMDDSSKHDFFHGHLQFPVSAERQKIPTLLAIQIAEFHVIVDPKLYEWALYTTTTNLPSKSSVVNFDMMTASDTGAARKGDNKSLRTGTSDRDTRKLVGPRHTEGSTSTDKSISKQALAFISTWFPTLNAALIQVRADPVRVYFPRRSLQHLSVKNVAETIARATPTGKKSSPILGICLPTILLENVAHKPMIQQFLSNVPITFPESVWNISRDNLPWTLKLKNFSVFTHNGDLGKLDLLEPVTTNCTLGLNSRQHAEGGPTLGLCIHADMSPLKFTLRDAQMSLLVDLVEDIVSTAYKLCPDIFAAEKSSYTDDDNGGLDRSTLAGVRSGSPGPHPHLLEDEGSIVQHSVGSVSDPTAAFSTSNNAAAQHHLAENVDRAAVAGEETSALSLWLQWTLPQLTFALLVSESTNLCSKLLLEMEDCQSSFDWTPLYFQTKCRVLSAGLRHFEQIRESGDWSFGPYKGIVVSCSDDITRDLHTIAAKNNGTEILPHSHHFETDQTCFSFVFTRAECSNVQKKWRELLRTSKSYRTLLNTDPENADHRVKPEDRAKRFVSEVDIKLAPIDVVLVAEILLPFVKMVAGRLLSIDLSSKSPPQPQQQQQSVLGMAVNNNTLPLLYLKGKTVRVFVIARAGTTTGDVNEAESDTSSVLSPDTFLFNCDSIVVTPQVENKLSRILIRPELFHLSQAILNIPGSHIEDRQYEVNLNGLAVLTGRWSDIEEKSKKPAKPMLKTMGENPALEWNTAAEQAFLDGGQNNDVCLMPLISKFDLQVTFAPSIVYVGPDNKKTLIAGHSLEVNAKGEILFSISLGQIRLISVCIQQVITLYKAIFDAGFFDRKIKRGSNLDSGIDCGGGDTSGLSASLSVGKPTSGVGNSLKSSTSVSAVRFVPLEFLLTTNKISVVLFRLIESDDVIGDTFGSILWRKQQRRKRRLDPKLLDRGYESENSDLLTDKIRMRDVFMRRSITGDVTHVTLDVGYDASEEGSVEEPVTLSPKVKIFPLVFCSVSQPHLFMTASRATQKFEVSFYDSALTLSPPNYVITSEAGHRLPIVADFPNPLFQTKPGEPDKKSGIPPALLNFRILDFLSRETKIFGSVERPVKINANIALWRQLSEVIETLRSSSGIDDIMKLANSGNVDNEVNCRQNVDASFDWRSRLSDVSKVTLSTKQIVVHLSENSRKEDPTSRGELSFGGMGFSVECIVTSKFVRSRRSITDLRMDVKADKVLAALGIRGNRHLFLRPWTFAISSSMSWIDHGPVFNVRAQSEVLRLGIGPNHILSLIAISTHLQEKCPEFFGPGQSSSQQDSSVVGNVVKFLSQTSNESDVKNDQHYIDDLRAGAFQYVEADSADHTKPYQVVFTKTPAAMTWQYPQPRTLTRVSIFPVPFKSASESGIDFGDDKEVVCALQYWDKSLNSFRTYSEFFLSEQQVTHLDLPLTSDRKKVCVSEKWRIALDYEDLDSDNPDLDKEKSEIIVTPKSLVSVVRIDSYYNPKLIPKIQVSLSLSKIVLAVHNHLHFLEPTLPPPLNRFTLCPIYPLDQEVSTVTLDSTTFGVDVWSPEVKLSTGKRRNSVDEVNVNISMKCRLRVEYVDFRFLARHDLILPIPIQAGVFVILQDQGRHLVDISAHCRNIALRAGHFASRTLSVTHDIWRKVLETSSRDESNVNSSMEFITDYVVCNSSLEPIRFGQVDTEENVLLKPGECSLYAWRSQRARLQLRLCVDGGFWRWCDPFSIAEGVRSIRIDHGTHVSTLIVSVRNLATRGQWRVTISGLISTGSLLRERLEVRAVLKPNVAAALTDEGGKDPRHRTVLEGFSEAPSFVLQLDDVQGVKIRLSGIGTPWSGDIPLVADKGRRNCVLIRVPTKEKGHCTTVWCRLVEEVIEPNVTRALLLFSPMYTARSALPNPMRLLVTGSGNDKNLAYEASLRGREELVQLETPGSADQKYNLAFQVVDNLPPSDPVQMSWGIVERVRDKNYVTPSIDDILAGLPDSGKASTSIWPFVEEEDKTAIDWHGSIQPRTDVQVAFRQLHPLCNTLCVEVNPWCLLVNRLGVDLLIKVSETSVYTVGHNSVFAPPALGSTFRFGVVDVHGVAEDEDEKTFFGPPLQLTDQEWHFRSLMPTVRGMIPMEGISQTKIVCGVTGRMCFLTIVSKNENGMRIMEVRPTFSVANCTNLALTFAPLSFLTSEHHMTELATLSVDNLHSQTIDPSEEEELSTDLLFWNVTGSPSSDQLFDGFQHVMLKSEDSNWSALLNLEDCRNSEQDCRRSVSLPKIGNVDNSTSNILLFVTVHQRKGRVFLVLREDKRPQYLVHNWLKSVLYFMEDYKIEDGSSKHLYEVQGLTSFAFSSLKASDNLVKVESPKTGLKFFFSTIPPKGDDNGWEILDRDRRWSDPIDTSLTHEHFVAIPGYGDATLHIEQVSNTIHIFVEPVSKIQVSAKEIRSRIFGGGGHKPMSEPVRSPPSVSEDWILASPASSTTTTTEAEFLDSTHVSQGLGDESFRTTIEKSTMDERSFNTAFSPNSRAPSAASWYLTGIDETNATTNVDTDDVISLKPRSQQNQIQASLFIDEMSLTLTDDCCDAISDMDEFVRITFDSLALWSRPRVGFSQPLKCLGGQRPNFNDVVLSIDNVQVDNQMFRSGQYDYPVVLTSQDRRKKFKLPATNHCDAIVENLKRDAVILVQLTFDANEESNVLKSAVVSVKPLRVSLEDKFVHKMTLVAHSFGETEDQSSKQRRNVNPTKFSSEFTLKLPRDVSLSSLNLVRDIHLDLINIEELSALVSVRASLKIYIGLDQSSLNFAPYKRQNLVTTNYALGQSLARHYISGALFRAGWVVGSLDLIGSPAGFTRIVGDGIKDFVGMPYQGIFHGPWAFVSGITYGSTSLVKHVSAGTLTSMTNFASCVSRNLDRLSLDDEHCKRNEISRRQRPQGFGQGLVNGLSGVGISLLGAVGGIAHHPIQALIDGGASPSGLVIGITRGLVGVVAKPLGGAAELVAQTGQGLLQGTGWCEFGRQRSPCIPEPICSASSSSLKFSWKMLSTVGGRNSVVLYDMAEASKESSDHQWSASTLLLTSEAIFIVSAEEDAQEAVFALSEVECRPDMNDPTKFLFVVPQKDDSNTFMTTATGDEGNRANSSYYNHERVVQFIMESSGTTLGLNDENPISGLTRKDENSLKVAFHASPSVTTGFLEMFSIMSARGNKGFDLL